MSSGVSCRCWMASAAWVPANETLPPSSMAPARPAERRRKSRLSVHMFLERGLLVRIECETRKVVDQSRANPTRADAHQQDFPRCVFAALQQHEAQPPNT